MDFVVLGFGLGALAVLVGLGLRDLGPLLRRVPRPDRDDLPWSAVAQRVEWGRTCRAAGLLVTVAGAGLCLLTLLVLIAGASDGVGLVLVVLAALIAIVGLGAWAVLDRQRAHRPGSAGGIRPRPRLGDRRDRPTGMRRTPKGRQGPGDAAKQNAVDRPAATGREEDRVARASDAERPRRSRTRPAGPIEESPVAHRERQGSAASGQTERGG